MNYVRLYFDYKLGKTCHLYKVTLRIVSVDIYLRTVCLSMLSSYRVYIVYTCVLMRESLAAVSAVITCMGFLWLGCCGCTQVR